MGHRIFLWFVIIVSYSDKLPLGSNRACMNALVTAVDFGIVVATGRAKTYFSCTTYINFTKLKREHYIEPAMHCSQFRILAIE